MHFSDSAKLNEARAKEWESLSNSTITHASVNRDTILEDILQLYRMNETLTSTPLEVTFLNDPAEDADGLTHKLSSQGWKNILPLFFEGTNFHVPRWIQTVLKSYLKSLVAWEAMALFSLDTNCITNWHIRSQRIVRQRSYLQLPLIFDGGGTRCS